MESAKRSCFDLSRGGKSARPLLSQAPGRALPRRARGSSLVALGLLYVGATWAPGCVPVWFCLWLRCPRGSLATSSRCTRTTGPTLRAAEAAAVAKPQAFFSRQLFDVVSSRSLACLFLSKIFVAPPPQGLSTPPTVHQILFADVKPSSTPILP
jgi:hypothetical protein